MTVATPHLPTATVDLKAICHNYAFIAAKAGATGMDGSVTVALPVAGSANPRLVAWPAQAPLVKADAYGHGHIRVSEALLGMGATALASGRVQEAVALRQGLRERCPLPAVCEPIVFSMLGPIVPDDLHLCLTHDIVPIIHFREQLDMLEAVPGNLAVAIKCNTGMSRLGFDPHELPAVVERLQRLPGIRPVLAVSHLTSSDSGSLDTVREQSRIFAQMLGVLRGTWPDMAASLCNSGGTLLAGDVTAIIGPHMCRPGVVLYGVNPFAGKPQERFAEGLRPAMHVSAPIIAVRDIPTGAPYGYDRTFVAPQPTRIAIVAVGYADFYARRMSSHGGMCIDGQRVPVIGRVSMQMTGVDISALPPGGPESNTAWILGGPHANGVAASELATLWDTIPYEIFCQLGNNNRMYTD